MRFWFVPIACTCLLAASAAYAQVTTSQYDNSRTGATLNETILTPQNVNARQFGRLGAFHVDSAVFAQPLFVPGVEIPGKGKHNVLYVATEHDSVYAFDVDQPGSEPLWHVNFLDKQHDIDSVSSWGIQCPLIAPEVGITSTPVIDLPSGTLYVLARTRVVHTIHDEFYQHLHALAITTGVEKFGGPVRIEASVPGKGAGSENGQVRFNTYRENPRASLLLSNGVVYLSWASSCDIDPYHGWIMAYDAHTLAQKAVLNVTPDGNEGGIWESDTGPAADASGNVFVPTGNGKFDAGSGGRDFSDSVLKLSLEGPSLRIADYFTPSNEEQLNDGDSDLGSSGPTLLPDQPGPHRHLLIQPTKGSELEVIDRDKMGKFRADRDADVQKLDLEGGAFGAIAYWNQHVYIAASGGSLRDYAVERGELKLVKQSSLKFDNPGATPSVSANGAKNAIVWAIATRSWSGSDQPAVLSAFDAKNIAEPIYSSSQSGRRDRAGLATRFVIPVVVNGKVYFGTRDEVEVYGLFK